MIINIIELEDTILQNKEYLIDSCPHTQEILNQLSMILDFGMDSTQIDKWLRLNQVPIRLIYELLEKIKTQ